MPTSEPILKWKEYGNIRIIENFEGETIDISNNIREWRGKSLVIRDCYNLKEIKASSSDLESLEITENCPKLQDINVSLSELKEISLNGCENLINLNCSNNLLKKLDLTNNKKLKNVFCNHNLIADLKVRHLNNLENLYCQNNNLIKLDCRWLKKLIEISCAGNVCSAKGESLKKLLVDGCEALEFIDCAENDIELLVLKNLSNLKTVSARENNLNKLILKGLKNLEYLDSNIQVNNGKLEIRFNGEFNSFETFYYDEDTNFFFNNKQVEKEKLWNNFPKLRIFECDANEENPAFMEWIIKREQEKERERLEKAMGNSTDSAYASDEENQKKKKNESEPIITDPSQLKNRYPDLLDVYGQESEITITGNKLVGTLIIDGYQGSKINVGNNENLHYLWIKNCPHLTTLRYAHCGLKNGDAFIDWNSCRNLRPENINKYNCDGGIEWGNWEEKQQDSQEDFNEELKNAKEKKEQIKNKVKSLLNRVKKGDNIPFAEFLELAPFVLDFSNKDLSAKFGEIFIPRLRAYVQELINNYSKMSKADFESEVKKILPFWNLLTPELKKQLAMLTKTQQSEVAISNQKNYWPKIVVGIIFVVILCLILLSYLARNRKIIKKTKIKN